jgi:hypothetical protein
MSGTVRDAFKRAGCYAISCDLYPTMSPGPHYEGDLFSGALDFSSYDLIIAHPPCTHICRSGSWRWRNTKERADAIDFFMRIWNIRCKKLCIENSVGIMNRMVPSRSKLPLPQFVEPYWFGHTVTKKTGLWKRNLPDLTPSRMLEPHSSGIQNVSGYGEERRILRSITYLGIANAMAKQWAPLLFPKGIVPPSDEPTTPY